MEVEDIVTGAQAACILEVSCPKPGNVSRSRDFGDTRYGDFLVSGVAVGSALREAAERGRQAAMGDIALEDIGIGRLIKEAVLYSRRWHSGGNTNLGIAMLLVPLCAAFGMGIPEEQEDREVRKNIDRLVKAATCLDAVELFEVIRETAPGGMGSVEAFDVMDPASAEALREEDKNFYEVMRMTEGDSIASELTSGMGVSFEVGLPAITGAYREGRDLDDAILHGFLEVLSRVPDTLISRKNGREAAEEISREARKLLESGADAGGLEAFDSRLRSKGNLLNPGTTADLVASSLAIALIRGMKI